MFSCQTQFDSAFIFWIQPFNFDASDLLTLLYLIRTPKTSMKGVEQNRKKASESRVSNKALSGV